MISMLKKLVHGFCLMVLSVLLSLSLFAQNDEENVKYTHLYDPVMCTIKNYFTVQNTSNRELTDIKIKILVGIDDSLYQNAIDLSITPAPSSWEEDKLGNYYAVIEVASLAAGKKVDVVISRIVTNYAVVFDKSIYDINVSYADFLKNPANRKYIQPSASIQSADPLFAETIKNLDRELPEAQQAYVLFSHVNTNMTYDTDKRYANTTALSGLKTGRGVCTEFSGVFVGLCRAAGIPARIVSGYWPRREFKKGVETAMAEDDRHAWAEFYLPTVGWIPVEPSATLERNGKRVANENSFAAIVSSERYFVYSYGLNEDRESNIAVEYSYDAPEYKGSMTSIGMTKETITVH